MAWSPDESFRKPRLRIYTDPAAVQRDFANSPAPCLKKLAAAFQASYNPTGLSPKALQAWREYRARMFATFERAHKNFSSSKTNAEYTDRDVHLCAIMTTDQFRKRNHQPLTMWQINILSEPNTYIDGIRYL